MSNVVEFLLRAKDQVSPVIQGLRSQFDGLDNVVKGLETGLGFGLAYKGIDAAIASVGRLQDAFTKAAQSQTQLIASASDVGANLGTGIKPAREMLEGLQGSIARMAGDLPGTTEQYNTLFNGFSSSLSRTFAGDTEGFKAAAEDMTKRAGVLAAIRQVSGAEAGSTLNRLLGGTMGFGEARQLDLLQKNPVLQTAIEGQARQKGLDISQLQKWSMQDRYQVIASALKLATPDSLINEFKGTAESIVQSWQTNLFDPIVGIFGVSRRVAERGNRNALDALTNWLTQLDILAKELGGISFDPMRATIDFFDGLSIATARLTSMAQQGTSFNLEGLIDWMRGLDMYLVDNLNKAVDGLKVWLSNADWASVGATIWRIMESGWDNLAKVVMAIDWLDIVKVLANGVTASFELVLGALGEVAKDLVNVIKGWYDQIKGTVASVGGVVSGIGGAVSTPIDPVTAPLDAIGGFLSDRIKGIPLGQSSTTNAPFTANVSINGQLGEDPQAFAERVVAVLDDSYQEYQRQFLGVA